MMSLYEKWGAFVSVCDKIACQILPEWRSTVLNFSYTTGVWTEI
jgi:hypothetical protein